MVVAEQQKKNLHKRKRMEEKIGNAIKIMNYEIKDYSDTHKKRKKGSTVNSTINFKYNLYHFPKKKNLKENSN